MVSAVLTLFIGTASLLFPEMSLKLSLKFKNSFKFSSFEKSVRARFSRISFPLNALSQTLTLSIWQNLL
jgi:hypothetical protein